MNKARTFLMGMAIALALAGCPTGNSGEDPSAADPIPAGVYKQTGSGWVIQTVSPFDLAAALEWIRCDEISGTAQYRIVLDGNAAFDDIRISPNSDDYSPDEDTPSDGKSFENKTVTLRSSDAPVTITPNASGKYVRVGVRATESAWSGGSAGLILENIAVQGLSANTAPLFELRYGGKLTINGGADIHGNVLSGAGYGVSAAVRARNDSVLTLAGGTIRDNTSQSDAESTFAAINVQNDAQFFMTGGIISGNRSVCNSTAPDKGARGAVYLDGNAQFTMSGGQIRNNAIESAKDAMGGGVYMTNNAHFTMSGGEISGNTIQAVSWAAGGGIAVMSNSRATYNAGDISGNSVSAGGSWKGHQVYKSNSASVIDGSGGISIPAGQEFVLD